MLLGKFIQRYTQIIVIDDISWGCLKDWLQQLYILWLMWTHYTIIMLVARNTTIWYFCIFFKIIYITLNRSQIKSNEFHNIFTKIHWMSFPYNLYSSKELTFHWQQQTFYIETCNLFIKFHRFYSVMSLDQSNRAPYFNLSKITAFMIIILYWSLDKI